LASSSRFITYTNKAKRKTLGVNKATLKKYGGEDEVILMGGFFRYMMLSFIPLWGLSQGFQPFIGTNFGAGLFDRVKKGTFWFYGFGILLATIAWGIFMLFPQGVLSLFIREKALVAKGAFNALVAFSIYPLVPMLILNITLFQSLGKAKGAGILTIGRQFLFFVPLCIILSMFIGARGVWFAMPITDGFTFLLSLVLVIDVFNKDLKKTIE